MIVLSNTPVIETERLILRAPNAGDWEPWRAFAMSDRSQFIGGPYTLDRAWRGAGHVIGHWVMRGFGSFAITLKGSDTAVGLVGPWYPAIWPERELGWSMWRADLEGTGLMFEAASAARDHAFGALGWDTAVSYIDARNARSIRLAERLGATLDADAEAPEDDPGAEAETLVYRHSTPGAAA